MKISTKEVLVWKDANIENNVYDTATQSFKTIGDFDPNLANIDVSTKNVIHYTDPTGVEWIVSIVPFFQTATFTSSNPSPPTVATLAVLVFANKKVAQATLNDFNDQISNTTNDIFKTTIIIIACTAIAVILFMIVLILLITAPLETMRKLSHEIMEISAEDEDKKDYGVILQKSFTNLNRTDEIGLLASDYYHVVSILHDKNLEKRETPKYPPNPFHIDESKANDVTLTDWTSFLKIFHAENRNRKISKHDIQNKQSSSPPKSDHLESLDVLGSILSQRDKKAVGRNEIIPVDTSDDIEAQDNITRHPEKVSKKLLRGRGKYYSLHYKEKKVGYLTSLKSQLYSLSTILLCGCMVTMIITIVSLSKQGVNWMDNSSSQITNSQIQNMISITNTKTVYISVRYDNSINLHLFINYVHRVTLNRLLSTC